LEHEKLVAKTGLTSALRGTWVFFTVVSALGLLVSFGIKRKKLQREDGRVEAELGASEITDGKAVKREAAAA
jgi:hypothetical protein